MTATIGETLITRILFPLFRFQIVRSIFIRMSEEPMSFKRGAFIVFEGIDRCGKSTQTKLLHKFLNDNGHKCVLMRFPSKSHWLLRFRNVIYPISLPLPLVNKNVLNSILLKKDKMST